MAEIDLVKVWERGKQARSSSKVPVDLDKAAQGKSRSTLRWIGIILMIELGLNLAVTPLIYLWWKKLGFTWQFWFFLSVVLIYVAYYIFLIRAIHRFDFAVNVRDGLRRIYRYLRFYLLHYKVVIWLIFPICYAYGLYTGLEEDDFPELSTERWTILIGVSVLLSAAFSSFFNWMINLIYGRKIKRLKVMVAELERAD